MEIRYHYQELEDHFDGEDDAKNQVADLDRLGEPVWLVVVLDAHAEGVDQDAEEDEALKRVVVDKRLDVHLNGCQELSDAVVARMEPEKEKSRHLVIWFQVFQRPCHKVSLITCIFKGHSLPKVCTCMLNEF